jgi:hypothetical protein
VLLSLALLLFVDLILLDLLFGRLLRLDQGQGG